MTVPDVLHGTIEILRRDGWCKRSICNDKGERCVVGALLAFRAEQVVKANALPPIEEPYDVAIAELDSEAFRRGHQYAVLWNDRVCSGIEEAIGFVEETGNRYAALTGLGA